jgi:hypothetical protein
VDDLVSRALVSLKKRKLHTSFFKPQVENEKPATKPKAKLAAKPKKKPAAKPKSKTSILSYSSLKKAFSKLI